MNDFSADVIVIGAGLAGMTAAHEAISRGRRVLMLDQEGPQSLGGASVLVIGRIVHGRQSRAAPPWYS